MNADQLRAICPTIGERAEAWTDALNYVFAMRFIDTPRRQAAFVANVAHESGEFVHMIENLNYSAEALLRVFPRYFNPVDALNYARNPERIANRVYANRMGNGDEASGDGWKFRGRGLLQHTGKNNYAHLSILIFQDGRMMDEPDLLLDPGIACEAAGVYWTDHNLNNLADTDFDSVCDVINIGHATLKQGDSNGFAARLAYFNRGLDVL